MSDEEHLIENLICYVQSVGWANVPDKVGSLDFHNVYKRYGNNGRTEVDRATFKWLLDMAVYVVYQATVVDVLELYDSLWVEDRSINSCC